MRQARGITHSFLILSTLVACMDGTVATEEGAVGILEGFPDAIAEHIEWQDSAYLDSMRRLQDDPDVFQSVVTLSRRWLPGQTLLVAFNGGDVAVRDSIARVASTWSNFANIRLSFLADDGTGYREWSETDTEYAAHIRIAFDRRGYWSFVGSESIDRAYAGPGSPSMNFNGFAQGLPADWAQFVLHEFGHAIAFQHEHQHPLGTCESEFRWDDDPGYVPTTGRYGNYVNDAGGRRPGIYTVLSGYPNFWKRSTTDFNLRELAFDGDIGVTDFDPASIMKYYFEAWMFRSGETSKCFSPEALTLSAGDQAAAADHYPSFMVDSPNPGDGIEATLARFDLSPATLETLAERILAALQEQAAISAAITDAQTRREP